MPRSTYCSTRQEGKPVVRAERRTTCKLIDVSAADKAERLEYLERRVLGQAVDVHDAGLLDDMVRIILFVDSNGDAVGRIGNLRDGVDNQAVVFFAIVGGNDIEPVSDFEER